MELTHFQVLRSHSDKQRFLIILCNQDTDNFDAVPQPIRALGPWMAGARLPVIRLRSAYRAALARDGFCLVVHAGASFDPSAVN